MRKNCNRFTQRKQFMLKHFYFILLKMICLILDKGIPALKKLAETTYLKFCTINRKENYKLITVNKT